MPRHVAHSSSTTSPHAARRRLLHLHHAFGCLGTSRDSSSTTSPHVARRDYFTYAVRSGASARRATRHAARCRLLRLTRLVVDYLAHAARSRHAARHRLLRLCHVSGCLGMSCGSSSTIFPMPCIRARSLAARLLVGRSHWLSPCAQSLYPAARLRCHLTCCLVALSLLRLRRASGRAVLLLDFSSVDRTGPRRAPSHSVSRLDFAAA
jgi:hypothetical protein